MTRYVPPSLDFFPDRYLGSTQSFSLEEHGAYLLLLMEQWQQGSIPKSVSAQMRICRISSEDHMRKIWEAIGYKFELIIETDDSEAILVNPRMHENRVKSVEKYAYAVERARRNGAKGGRPKKPTSVLSETNIGFVRNLSPEEGRGKGEGGRDTFRKEESLFEQFWSVVHVKIGKQAALKAFQRATKIREAESIIDAMREFASSPQATPKDRSPIHPATWLNQGRYDDDRATWRGHEREPMTITEMMEAAEND